jgi:hypothetical protein
MYCLINIYLLLPANPTYNGKNNFVIPSLENLWSFVNATELSFIEIHIQRAILSCTCSEIDVELAIGKFNAGVLELAK